MMNTHYKIINLDFLADFARNDVSKMKRYIEMYLKSTPQVIQDLQSELDNQNWENLKLKAHSIKPQAQYMGIDQLKAVLIEIETIIKNDGDKSLLQPLVIKATEINAKAVEELTQFFEN